MGNKDRVAPESQYVIQDETTGPTEAGDSDEIRVSHSKLENGDQHDSGGQPDNDAITTEDEPVQRRDADLERYFRVARTYGTRMLYF